MCILTSFLGLARIGHILRPRRNSFENKFSSVDSLANCHWQLSLYQLSYTRMLPRKTLSTQMIIGNRGCFGKDFKAVHPTHKLYGMFRLLSKLKRADLGR